MPCQQDALYAAERNVTSKGRTFGSEAELQVYVDELRDTDWWARNFDNVCRIDCFFRPQGSCSVGGFHAESGAGVIEMLPPHRNELIVLHEVCHVLAQARYGSHAHDPWFARTYLEAVYAFLGSDAYGQLWTEFKQAGIDTDTDNGVPAGRVL